MLEKAMERKGERKCEVKKNERWWEWKMMRMKDDENEREKRNEVFEKNSSTLLKIVFKFSGEM